MRGFDVTVRTRLAPQEAWDAVTHWPAHGGHVPLTTVTVTRDGGGLGDEFVGRTGVRRVGFDDPMRVTRWQPPAAGAPGVCEITKLAATTRRFIAGSLNRISFGRLVVQRNGECESFSGRSRVNCSRTLGGKAQASRALVP